LRFFSLKVDTKQESGDVANFFDKPG